jgi:hypothetical protein
MKHIVLFLVFGLIFFSCDNTKTDDKESNQKENSKTKIKNKSKESPKKFFKTEEIGEISLIFGEWKIVDIGAKALPEDRKDITATFMADGDFERRLSPNHQPEKGTWSVGTENGYKFLKLNIPSGNESNQLIKLTKDELVFINFRKPVRMRKSNNNIRESEIMQKSK